MKDKFKTEERQQLIIEKKQTVKPLGREIRVFVEKVRPIYEGPDGERKGPPHVKIVLSRGKGFVALTPAEAKEMSKMILEVLEPALETEKTCEEEKKAWVQREDEKFKYQPGAGVGTLTPGKTERDRKKKQAKMASGEYTKPSKLKKEKKPPKESKKSRKEKRKEGGK